MHRSDGSLVLGCEARTAAVNEPAEAWSSEPVYEIGDALEGDALFTRVDDIRISADGERVFVLEGSVERLTLWSREGTLLAGVGGRGGGPGEFEGAAEVGMAENGFFVRDLRRFTVFTHTGALLETVAYPPPSVSFRGFRIEPRLMLEDGGFLAIPAVPASVMAGWMGDDPVRELPILRLSRNHDAWTIDTVGVVDQRNRDLSIGPEDRSFAWGFTPGSRTVTRTNGILTEVRRALSSCEGILARYP